MSKQNQRPHETHAPHADKSKSQMNGTAVDTDQPPVTTLTPATPWNLDAIFWGLLFVAVGTLVLLGNLGIIEVNWNDLWRLWPLLIVATGFSMLASSHWLWKTFSVLFIVITLGLVGWVGAGFYTSDSQDLTSQSAAIATNKDIKNAELRIEGGASDLAITSSETSKIVEARLQGEGVHIQQKSQRSGSTQNITLSSDSSQPWWPVNWNTKWDVTLSEQLPLKLTLDAGASSIEADLSRVKLRELAVKAGASSSTLTLGDRLAATSVTIDAGASSTTLRIPKTSGITLNFDGGLSTRNFDGLEKLSDGTYQTKNYDAAAHKVTIDVDAGLSSFTIERY